MPSPIMQSSQFMIQSSQFSESRIDSTREFPHAAAGMHAECRPAVASCRTVGDPNTGGARNLGTSGGAGLWYLGSESVMGTILVTPRLLARSLSCP